MSPEQCRAEPLDRRSDVFALGVLLYELTTGERPFRAASDFEMLSAIVAGRYDAADGGRPDYPAALEAVVRRALETDPDRRFPMPRRWARRWPRWRGSWARAAGPRTWPAAWRSGSRGRGDHARTGRGGVPRAGGRPSARAPTRRRRPRRPCGGGRPGGGRPEATALAGCGAGGAGGGGGRRIGRGRAVGVVAAGAATVPAVRCRGPGRPRPLRPRRRPVPPLRCLRRPWSPAPAAAPTAPPARRRAAPRPRPPDGQTVWDPDSAKLP